MPSFLDASDDCYDIGYRYGRCAVMSYHGLRCQPEDDVVPPTECRGKDAAHRGIEAGKMAAQEALNKLYDGGK